jgi:hypothetical protein
MEVFYYRVGYVETRDPWFLPNFDRVRNLFLTLKSDDELEDFRISLHGQLLHSWNAWDVELFLEYENWQTNLDLNFLERIMAKIYKYGFNQNLLLDITFCGNHQLSDTYLDAEARDFDLPSFNYSDFIKFNQNVKSIDGNSEESFVSNYFQTTQVTNYLVQFSNNGLKYNDWTIDRYKNENYIFKEGIDIDIFLSFNSNQFEEVKKYQ